MSKPFAVEWIVTKLAEVTEQTYTNPFKLLFFSFFVFIFVHIRLLFLFFLSWNWMSCYLSVISICWSQLVRKFKIIHFLEEIIDWFFSFFKIIIVIFDHVYFFFLQMICCMSNAWIRFKKSDHCMVHEIERPMAIICPANWINSAHDILCVGLMIQSWTK